MILAKALLAVAWLLLAVATIKNASKLAELDYRLTNIELDIQEEEELRNRSHVPPEWYSYRERGER